MRGESKVWGGGGEGGVRDLSRVRELSRVRDLSRVRRVGKARGWSRVRVEVG